MILLDRSISKYTTKCINEQQDELKKHSEINLENFIKLVNLYFADEKFIFDGIAYKQIHGPLNIAISILVLQKYETIILNEKL